MNSLLVEVRKDSSGRVKQTYTTLGGGATGNRSFRRTSSSNAGVWSAWKEV